MQQAAAGAVVVAKPRAPLRSDSEDIDIDSPDNSNMDSDDARDTKAQAAPSGSGGVLTSACGSSVVRRAV